MSKIKQALISVSDKRELNLILKTLKKFGIKTLSSGGTYKFIKQAGYECQNISKYTGFNEILGGRVKTLHPKIHAGILNVPKNKKHEKEMKLNNFENIELVIVNFYPFKQTLLKTKKHKKIIENIDIGGPAMARGAAKNYENTTVLTNINQYKDFLNELKKNNGSTSLEFRKRMSEESFIETAYYDSQIASYFSNLSGNFFSSKKVISADMHEKLRYGENPHQSGAVYTSNDRLGIEQLNGKKLSYNNYNDIFAALNITKTLSKNNGTVIVKHANPCGVSINKNKIKSFKEALQCDPLSAYGGIISFNFKLNEKLAQEVNKIFFEVVIAKGFEKKALNLLKKKKSLRIIDSSNYKPKSLISFYSDQGNILMQNIDNQNLKFNDFKVVSKKKPNLKILKNLIFAFNVTRGVKSNAIVLSAGTRTVGIGSGQPSRLDSCEIAIKKMNTFQKNIDSNELIAASDAFFPFIDGIEKLVQSGVSAVIQPSGSIRDNEIIKFADRTGTILVFSKTRHFKH